MKTGPDALDTAENESGLAKHENGTRRTRHCRKRVRERKIFKRDLTLSLSAKISSDAQNMKTGPDALVTVENESGRAEHENWTRRLTYRRKRVQERKT
jgi:hypothetical protein